MIETRLLRSKTILETVREMELLYEERLGQDLADSERDEERVRFLTGLQRRLRALEP